MITCQVCHHLACCGALVKPGACPSTDASNQDPAPAPQDGTIQHETKLTGCLSTNVLSEGEGPAPQHGTLLAPGLNAQHHQHFFCARLDPAIDDPAGGAALTVVEVRLGAQYWGFLG